MKTRITPKLLLLTICLFVQFSVLAEVSKTIHVATAGTLPTLAELGITNLTLTGNLNGTDIAFIRQMTESDTPLTVLNLAEANIVSGGDPYDEDYYTSNNKIGDWAFSGCGLTSITLPNSVISIEECAFWNCYALTSVTLPNSVTSIGNGAFFRCIALAEFIVSEQNRNYSATEGVLFDKDKKTIIAYPNRKIARYIIPNSVISIGAFAFKDCWSLTSVIIGNSVTSIGNGAFSGCIAMTSATIGNNVTSIGESVFFGCQSLTSAVIPSSVTSIGDDAFHNCIAMTSIAIPNSVISIGSGAFTYCTGLTSVTIGNSVTSVGSHAFYDCTSLTKLYSNNATPPNLRGTYVFYNTPALYTLFVPLAAGDAYRNAEGWKNFASIRENESNAIQ